MEKIVEEAGAAMKPLKKLQHKQAEMAIVRSAGPFTRIAHLLRAIDQDAWPEELLKRIDDFSTK